MLIWGVMATLHCTIGTVRGCLPSLVPKCRHFCFRLWSWWKSPQKFILQKSENLEKEKKYCFLNIPQVSGLLRHMCRACFSLMKLHCIVRTRLGEKRLRFLSYVWCASPQVVGSHAIRAVAQLVVKLGGWIDWLP